MALEITGFCECGCGRKTTIARKSDRAKGAVRGKPRRFIRGHHHRRAERYRVEDRGYTTPCWIWLLKKLPRGYGQMRLPGTRVMVLAHRWYYEQRRGPIPAGLVVDHKCRQPSCVNPDHLRAVTQAVNVRAGYEAQVAV